MTLLKSYWGTIIVLGGLIGTTLGVMSAFATTPWVHAAVGGGIGGITVGLLILAIALLDRRTRLIYDRVRAGTVESRAMINIRPLLNSGPLGVDGWALPAETCERLAHEIRTRRPQVIVECGSGKSTLFMAVCLKKFNIDGRIISLDHEPEYAEVTRNLLIQEGVEEFATVITAPLVSQVVGGKSVKWYNFNPEEHLDNEIDLLLVDGPPNPIGPMMRLPAAPILSEYMASNALIILDDGDRDDERKIAQAWSDQFDYEAKLEGNWRSYWTFQT